MIVGIESEILAIHALGLLERLLVDKTTKAHILWATDAYRDHGAAYERDKEMTAPSITGPHGQLIKNRARKALEQQSQRTRQRGEVFTPLWVCAKMNDAIDAAWFGRDEVFFREGQPTEHVDFPKRRRWQHYVDDRRLEITCGEAPYLVSRYDVSTGEAIPIPQRIGILDRKLRVVTENAADEGQWLTWVMRAFQSTYGYEFQGDNLLIARVNLLMTFVEYLGHRWHRKPTAKEYQTITNIIAWNCWQMDGLTGTLPYSKAHDDYCEMSLFDWMDEEGNDPADTTQLPCRIYDWRRDNSLAYKDVNTGGRNMKFDVIIGNPPYQETLEDTSDRPIYNKFMDAVYPIADKVELITPARFLFNAGKTPKAWNEKMLNDPHIKILLYKQLSSKVFANTDIKGGVVITYRDKTKNFGEIGTFTSFNELNSIVKKVLHAPSFQSIQEWIYVQNKFNLAELYNDYPDYKMIVGSGGKEKRLTTSIFSQLEVFSDERQSETDVKVLGLINNKRVYKYIGKEYLDQHENLYKYKVILPKSNGSGAIGEVLSTPLIGEPLIGEPLIGYTQSFISIGALNTAEEANSLFKYVKTKFMRTMLGVLKITQDNNKAVWKFVPVQNFAPPIAT